MVLSFCDKSKQFQLQGKEEIALIYKTLTFTFANKIRIFQEQLFPISFFSYIIHCLALLATSRGRNARIAVVVYNGSMPFLFYPEISYNNLKGQTHEKVFHMREYLRPQI
jgi:hypothetical protein